MPRYQDRDWLKEQWYSAESLGEIADKCGVSNSTITTWARRFDLPHFNDARPYNDPETLKEMYHEKGMSLSEMAEQFSCTDGWIAQKMEEFGIERRTLSKAQHNANPSAQFYTHPKGYELVASENADGNVGRCSVHQLVAIANGAEPARIFDGKNTIVYHRNGIKWDNRPENLEVMTNSEHAKMHYEQGDTNPHKTEPEQ